MVKTNRMHPSAYTHMTKEQKKIRARGCPSTTPSAGGGSMSELIPFVIRPLPLQLH